MSTTDTRTALKAVDKALVEDLLEALKPHDTRARAMFGAWMVYVNDKPTVLIGDGGIFVKRAPVADERLARVARLEAPYEGAREYWRLHDGLLTDQPDLVADLVVTVAAQLPAQRKRKPARRPSGA